MIDTDLSNFIPVDESWGTRMATLALLNGSPEFAFRLLDNAPLSKNLQCAISMFGSIDKEEKINDIVDCGSSILLCRSMHFLKTVTNLSFEIGYEKSLKDLVESFPEITKDMVASYSYEDWLCFDSGNPEWTSIAILYGVIDLYEAISYYESSNKQIDSEIALSLRCINDWYESREKDEYPSIRRNKSLLSQAFDFFHTQNKSQSFWIPKTFEDFPYAIATGRMHSLDSLDLHPSRNESHLDFVLEMTKQIDIIQSSLDKTPISLDCNDANMIISLSLAFCLGPENFNHSESIVAVWPKFWDFFKSYNKNVRMN